MNKELEELKKALEYMKTLFECWKNLAEKANLETKEIELEKYVFEENYDIIKNYILKTQEKKVNTNIIDNYMAFKNNDINSSEALKCLEKLGHLDLYESCNDLKVNEVAEFSFVKQALIKAQEIEEDNDVLLGENDDLYTELAFCEKQYKETIEYAKKCTKLLKLINEKNVDVRYFKQQCNTLNDYNYCQLFGDELSQEEFDLLKECFKYER